MNRARKLFMGTILRWEGVPRPIRGVRTPDYLPGVPCFVERLRFKQETAKEGALTDDIQRKPTLLFRNVHCQEARCCSSGVAISSKPTLLPDPSPKKCRTCPR